MNDLSKILQVLNDQDTNRNIESTYHNETDVSAEFNRYTNCIYSIMIMNIILQIIVTNHKI